MVPPANAPSRAPRASDGEARLGAPALLLLAWLVPGAAQVALGEVRKGVTLGLCIFTMFVLGLAFQGRIFPFQLSDPLVFLAAVAQWALGLPRLAAAFGGWGAGNVTAITYEYGSTFLITSGLLNALVVLDAYDRAAARAE